MGRNGSLPRSGLTRGRQGGEVEWEKARVSAERREREGWHSREREEGRRRYLERTWSGMKREERRRGRELG